ncbi:midasin-like [Asterias rubens]|uniref:midasin-like n=1 Tax=Asterias rubens TaxID=7604 RepID=UPI0014557DBE|nr:midasin-like [Asterias rubens]
MDEFRWDITSSLGRLVSTVSQPTIISYCQELLAKQIWTPADRQQLLAKLSEYLPHPQCTLPIAVAFRPILLELLERAGKQLRTRDCFSLEGHERLCIALGRLLSLHPDAYRFLMKYLQTSPPVFERLLAGVSEVKKAKNKKSKRRIPTPTVTDILRTCHKYLEFSKEAFVDLWDWSPILKLSEEGDVTTRW